MDEFSRSEITFEQAEGVCPLPSQMALKTTTPVLRARLWQNLLQSVEAEMERHRYDHMLGPKWSAIFRYYYVERLGGFADEVKRRKADFIRVVRPSFEKDDYVAVFGVTEWFVRRAKDAGLAQNVAVTLERERSAYRLVDNSLVPMASPEEGQALLNALKLLEKPGMRGARLHLSSAGSFLSSGKFADSTRESIHAVESVARSLTGKSSLRDALADLSAKHPMHPAFSKGLNSIYGYTSDANGIRHPMVGDEGASVGEPEAVFMLGACAAFVTFMTSINQDRA